MSRINVLVMTGFYLVAGANHFINPEFYLPLIPPYFTYPVFINTLSGLAEIVLGLGILFSATRTLSTYGIITMLIAFIPSHVYFISIGNCVEGGLCVPDWLGWIRLLIIHPLLILWAWKLRKVGPVQRTQKVNPKKVIYQ